MSEHKKKIKWTGITKEGRVQKGGYMGPPVNPPPENLRPMDPPPRMEALKEN